MVRPTKNLSPYREKISNSNAQSSLVFFTDKSPHLMRTKVPMKRFVMHQGFVRLLRDQINEAGPTDSKLQGHHDV